jgi:hypothetical protein
MDLTLGSEEDPWGVLVLEIDLAENVKISIDPLEQMGALTPLRFVYSIPISH